MAKARASKKPTAKEMSAFRNQIEHVLEQAGAQRTPGEGNDWKLHTKAGLLQITVYDGWVATRFDDVAAATKLIGSGINGYSGKWNHHFVGDMGPVAIDNFRWTLNRILPKSNPTKKCCACEKKTRGTLEKQYHQHVAKAQVAIATGDERAAMTHKRYAAKTLQKALKNAPPMASNPTGRRAFPMNDSGALAFAHDLSEALRGQPATMAPSTSRNDGATAHFFVPFGAGRNGTWVFVTADPGQNRWTVDLGVTSESRGHPQFVALSLLPQRAAYDKALSSLRRELSRIDMESTRQGNPATAGTRQVSLFDMPRRNPWPDGTARFEDYDWVVIAKLLEGDLIKLKRIDKMGETRVNEAIIRLEKGPFAGKTISVADNGGEVNIFCVDRPPGLKASETFHGTPMLDFSVPYWSDRGTVGDVTLTYRIDAALRGEPIDYALYLDGEEPVHRLQPPEVRRYFEETKKASPHYDDAQAWAVAWSRYCKHAQPSSPHCNKGRFQYFPIKGGKGSEGYGKIRAKQIALTVGEGPVEMSGKTVVLEASKGVDIWKVANEVLKDWARRLIPANAKGYWKQDFVITFADGFEYRGTYDLNRADTLSADLSKHVSDSILYASGLATHDDEQDAERYQKFLQLIGKDKQEKARKFIETYDFGPAFELNKSAARGELALVKPQVPQSRPISKGREVSIDSPAFQHFMRKSQESLNRLRIGTATRKLEAQDLKRYIRLSVVDGGSRSAWAFVDKNTGTVFNAASWKAPSKTTRGNVFDADV